MTEVFVDHDVRFYFQDDDECFIVPRRSLRGYVKVDGVSVHFRSNRGTTLFVSGHLCTKDGNKMWSRVESVDLDPEQEADWVRRAQQELANV